MKFHLLPMGNASSFSAFHGEISLLFRQKPINEIELALLDFTDRLVPIARLPQIILQEFLQEHSSGS